MRLFNCDFRGLHNNRRTATKSRVRWIAPSIALACGFAAGTVQSASAETANRIAAKSDRFVKTWSAAKDKTGSVDVILKLSSKLGPEQRNKLAGLKAGVYRDLPFIQSVAVHVPKSNLG